jgi:hypothetical protein
MFGGEPALTPAHLAKWLLLREQWPALGRAVAVAPDELRELELAASTDRLKRGLAALHVRAGDVEELSGALSREPRLSDVIERLVYFQPSDHPPAEEEP